MGFDSKRDFALQLSCWGFSFALGCGVFFATKDGEALYNEQKQDRKLTEYHELLITKFRLKLKKVGKTAKPFRYDLNQVPYDYTVEVIQGIRQSN